MAPAPIDPYGWGGAPNIGFVEWVLGAAWAILIFIAARLRRSFTALQGRVTSLDQELTEAKMQLAMIDHDLKGVRQNQNSLELAQVARHKENQAWQESMRLSFETGIRDLQQRIDQLLMRGPHK